MQIGGTIDLAELLEDVLKDPACIPRLGSDIPCFGHPLYDRDPRAEQLLEMIRSLSGRRPARDRLLDFVDMAQQRWQKYPNLFASLVILALSLGLPKTAAAYLHTLSRTAGWIAHAAEQRLTGLMLRPRARYMAETTPESLI